MNKCPPNFPVIHGQTSSQLCCPPRANVLPTLLSSMAWRIPRTVPSSLLSSTYLSRLLRTPDQYYVKAAHIFNPHIQEAALCEFTWSTTPFPGQPVIHSETLSQKMKTKPLKPKSPTNCTCIWPLVSTTRNTHICIDLHMLIQREQHDGFHN